MNAPLEAGECSFGSHSLSNSRLNFAGIRSRSTFVVSALYSAETRGMGEVLVAKARVLISVRQRAGSIRDSGARRGL